MTPSPSPRPRCAPPEDKAPPSGGPSSVTADASTWQS
jgi:hypothetical protein